MEAKKPSTYYFIGTLSDPFAKFNVQEYPLGDGHYLEVYFDGIAVWGTYAPDRFEDLRQNIGDALDTITAAFAFQTRKPIQCTLLNWVEAKGVDATQSVVGWILKRPGRGRHYAERDSRNTPWKRSGSLYRNRAKVSSNHLLALKDWHLALADHGDNAFLFAYRALEDICRAATGCATTDSSSWKRMHALLGTSADQVKPLTDISKVVRHGHPVPKERIIQRGGRDNILEIARSVMEQEFRRTLPEFLA